MTISTTDTLHRLVKEAVDSGTASTFAEAEQIFSRLRLGIEIAPEDAENAGHQIALLTCVALARRVFLGGVRVRVPTDVPLLAPQSLGITLSHAVAQLGGEIDAPTANDPLITVGNQRPIRGEGFHIRTFYSGWRGGIIPGHWDLENRASAPAMHLAPILAAALAINEAFFFIRTGNSTFGRRAVGLSLWEPSSSLDWLTCDDGSSALSYLPSKLWLIGLGHLGQAYLWGLGMLPYSANNQLSLVLQDTDVVTPSTESTSILTDSSMVGKKKTRAMAEWAERRGFTSTIVERSFGQDLTRQPHEPSVALCGIDNAMGRQALDQAGFDFIVEAGLGHGHLDFRRMRLHILPGPRASNVIWRETERHTDVSSQPAYQKLLNEGHLDRCGVTLLAGKGVGAPFVGTIASALALSEILRLLHGGVIHQLIDVDLECLEHRTLVPHSYSFNQLNPGFVNVAC